MKKFRYIELSGYTDKNTTTLWYNHEIFMTTSFDPADFDYAERAEEMLLAAQEHIRESEKINNWVPGVVTAWINEFEIEETA